MSDGDEAAPLTIDDLTRPRQSKPLRELPGLTARALAFVWRSSRRGTVALTLASVAQSVLTIGLLAAGARLISKAQELDGRGTVADVAPVLVIFVACLVLQSIAASVAREVRLVLSERTASRAQRIVGGTATRAPLLMYEEPAFHDRLQRALANSATRPIQVTAAVATLVLSTLVSAFLIAALAVLQALVLVAIAVGVVPLWLATRRLTRIGYEFSLTETEDDRRRNYLLFLMTSKDSAQELRAYQWGSHLAARHRALWELRIGRVNRYAWRRLRMSAVSAMANGLIVAAVVVLLAWTVADGRSGLAAASAAGVAVLLLGTRLASIAGAVGSLYECALFLADVEAFTNAYPESESSEPTSELATDPSTGSARPVARGELRAEHVTFQYPTGSRPALGDVSVAVRSGELVALVGANGSGKTTLAKLLAGLLPPGSGEVSWNGTPVESGDAAWHDQVAVTFQDHLRLLMSLRENVGLGRVTSPPTDLAVLAALDEAGLGQLVTSLPKGVDSLLGPQFFGGTDLSGGQWQRVALARAFFRDAGVIILDEPSSALDPDAEAALFETVHELCAGRAVIVISHRFSTVTRADRIYVLSDGAVIESGNHAELLALGGEYARMFRLQASRYEMPGDSVSNV